MVMADAERRQAILGVFEADLPEGLRILNAGAVTEEIEHGRDATVDDDDLASEETYFADRVILRSLVEAGILQTGEYLGMTVYGFTIAHQEELIAERKIERREAS